MAIQVMAVLEISDLILRGDHRDAGVLDERTH